MSLGRASLVVLDTETSGLAHFPWARIVEVGAVALAPDYAEIAAFSMLVRPAVLETHHIAARKAWEVNGLDPAQVARVGVPERTAAKLFSLWHIALGEPPVTSWRVTFDRPMMERMGVQHLSWPWCLKQQCGNLGLAKACAKYDIQRGQAHRALDDARDAAAVLRAVQGGARGDAGIFAALPLTGTNCPACGLPQRVSPSGRVCVNGHGF